MNESNRDHYEGLRAYLDSIKLDDDNVYWLDPTATITWECFIDEVFAVVSMAFDIAGFFPPQTIWAFYDNLLDIVSTWKDRERFLLDLVARACVGEIAEAEGPRCFSTSKLLGFLIHEECGEACLTAEKSALLRWCKNCSTRLVAAAVAWARTELNNYGAQEDESEGVAT